MRVEFAPSTGCPFGQFVIYGESKQDIAIIESFLQGRYDKKVQFWLHGSTYSAGHTRNFNFGWIQRIHNPSRLHRFIAWVRRIGK